MEVLCAIATIFVAYFLGSIPTGYLVAKAKGIDIRSVGSGNIGATNVVRILGRPAGIFVLVADGLKGFVASRYLVELATVILGNRAQLQDAGQEYLSIAAGLAAILGHIYTCWLRFKGGKGIATSAGVLAAWVPWTLVVGVALWVGVVVASRFVSLGSILAAISLPFATWAIGYSHRYITITALMSALAIYKHKTNIRRLLSGTESRFRFGKAQTHADQHV